MEDMRRVREKIAENTISFNEKVRRKELVEDKKRKELREKERQSRGPALEVQAYELTLDDLAAPKLRPVAFDRKQDKNLLDSDDDEATTARKRLLSLTPFATNLYASCVISLNLISRQRLPASKTIVRFKTIGFPFGTATSLTAKASICEHACY
mgnify:CR=1 FL=1